MDMNCSASYVSSLPVCTWTSACSAPSYCFHGDFGSWGYVYRCNAGGYYETSGESVNVCTGWASSGPGLSSGIDVSSDSGFDWGKVRTGFSDSFDFFVLIFAVWCIVKLIRSIR